MADKKKGPLKDGSRRSAGKSGRGGGMPRIMWLAILVCIVGAVFLFRTQGGDVPAGIGENQTVVTAPDVESHLGEDGPRSGEVDIATEAQDLTPEQPTGGAREAQPATTTAAAGSEPPATKPDPETTTPRKTTTKPATTTAKPAPPPIKPLDNGPYVVQTGSFGKQENADKEALRLQSLGWNALVKMGNASDGSMIYRVRIGYFTSRSQAESFIRQNGKQMRGAIAVHR